ncbi:hypothetical protein D210916BOD24_34650 [Alteromonas sp. D210916BOD_24]|uniref:helix-turn-helix domain-containing protein n=1 Tax=Alteromonas sp. D210916BOD_24 TaxID=3157618 RepID=UPI00399D0CDB
MKKIKYLIDEIKKVKTKAQFDSFFSGITSLENYCWAGIIIQENETATSINRKIIGDLPNEIIGKIFSELPHKFSYKKLTEIDYIFREEIKNSNLLNDDLSGILLLPFHGAGNDYGHFILGLSNRGSHPVNRISEKLGWFWSIVVPYLYAAYTSAWKTDQIHITKRELECIRWASEGKTSWEISQILNISERTANFHISNYIQKTGSTNRQQAIAKCLLKGHLVI